MLSLGRRLPVFIDTNLAPPASPGYITYSVVDATGKGPITSRKIDVPFYASRASTGVAGWLNPDYQEIEQITSMANSTYEAAMVKLVRYGRRGLSLHAHYTYAHAMDWNPGESPLDPANFSHEYGTSNLDVRHSAAAMVVYEAPWKLHNFAGRIGNGWMLSGIGQFHSGLPYTMRVTGSWPNMFDPSILGLRSGMNGSGGDNRIYSIQTAPNYYPAYNIGRNTYRYPNAWKADLRLAKRFSLGETGELEVMAESFNLFNHQNVTEIETTGYYIENSSTSPTLNFMTGLKANTTAFGHPLNINATDFYRERQIQLGLRMRF
jgi:hypothetical protein